jgi:hypothetical protein
LKGSVSSETFKEPTQREDAKKAIKQHFEERYAKGANRWCKFDPRSVVQFDASQALISSFSTFVVFTKLRF